MTNQDLIRQYVDTGIKIPEYQYNKLSGSLKKTYARKRIIHLRETDDYPDYWEMDFLPQEYKDFQRRVAYIRYRKGDLGEDIVFLPPEDQMEYVDQQKKYFDSNPKDLIHNYQNFSKFLFPKIAPEVRGEWLTTKVALQNPLTDEEFDSIEELESMEILTYPPKFKQYYLEELSKGLFFTSKGQITKKQFDSMTDLQKLNFSMYKSKYGEYQMLEPEQYEKFSESSKKKYDVFFFDKFKESVLSKIKYQQLSNEEYEWSLKNPYYAYWIFTSDPSIKSRQYSQYFYEKYYPFKD
jgi:hypothetical protein